MSFDFGNLGGLIPAIEERWGRLFASSVLFLGVLTFVVFCIGVIYAGAISPIYEWLTNALPNISLPEVNLVYLIVVGAIAALLIPLFLYFVKHRRVPQSVVDELAELRKDSHRRHFEWESNHGRDTSRLESA
jgi:predicted PurR-regulated permease PerM